MNLYKRRKCPNVRFKPVWKQAEKQGNRWKKPEKAAKSLVRDQKAAANEGSVSPVGSAKGKRPEFVSAKRAASALQARAATIERTERRANYYFVGGFLNRNERAAQWAFAKIEIAFRIPPRDNPWWAAATIERAVMNFFKGAMTVPESIDVNGRMPYNSFIRKTDILTSGIIY